VREFVGLSDPRAVAQFKAAALRGKAARCPRRS